MSMAEVYTVQSGDSLGGIATQHGVTVKQLQEWNKIQNANAIYVGQKIKVSAPARLAPENLDRVKVIRLKERLSLLDLATELNMSVSDLRELNGWNYSEGVVFDIGSLIRINP